jgi:hypothetical protein
MRSFWILSVLFLFLTETYGQVPDKTYYIDSWKGNDMNTLY